MRRTVGIALAILGTLFLLGAVLWWAFAVSALVKIPKDIDNTVYYEGEYTSYVDPVTYEFLAAGGEMTFPMQVRLNLLSEDDQYDADTAIISGSLETEVGGMKMKPAPFALALDRGDKMNQSDARAYVLDPDIVVDRSGSLSYSFPFGTSRDGDYSVWKEEIAQAVIMEFIGEEKKGDLALYNFRGVCEDREVVMDYVEFQGLPTTLSFNELAANLKGTGFDLPNLLALARPRLSPADQQAMDQIISQETPLIYLWSSSAEYSVEPVTGIIVDSYKDVEKASVKPDLTPLADLAAVLMKYSADPVLGPELQKWASMATAFEDYEGQKLVEYEYAQTPESSGESIEDAKKGKAAIGLAKTAIPVGLLVLGAVLLGASIFLLARGS